MFPNLAHLLRHQSATEQIGKTHRFFRLSILEDRQALEQLLHDDPSLKVCDQIIGQLQDLIKLEHPTRILSKNEIDDAIHEKLNGVDLHKYGVWVLYPWRHQLIHILDEEDFVKVRTIRNAYKITHEEQLLLRTKKIGVIGLSVGQSVALNIAMESIAGEIRLADFDILELSNLNRIRTGLYNLGERKTDVVYHEIAEIDPYIKVVIFEEGINSINIGDFLSKNGDLDLLVEECDSVEIKVLARKEASMRRIPVIMDTSDKGMVDIERFDLHPNYPILHGLIQDDVTFELLSQLKTSEEKLPYILPILGIESISKRLKASGLEVGKTITTWPQLGSEVALGGALCAHVGRRILLGENLQSGRTWIDLESNFQAQPTLAEETYIFEQDLKNDKIIEISQGIGILDGLNIEKEVRIKILEAASRAPSAGNNQKWRWHFRDDGLIIYVDKDKEYAYSDNLNIASLIGIGCCLENIVLFCSTIDILPEIQLCTQDKFPAIAAISFKRKEASHKFDYLSKYISARLTTRSNSFFFNGDKVCYQSFFQLIDSDNVKLEFVFEKDSIKRIGELVCQGDRIRLTNLQGHQEFFEKELRWNNAESEKELDGLDITLFDLKPLDLVGLKLSKDVEVIKFINSIGGGKGFERVSANNFLNADSIGFVYINQFSNFDLLMAGRVIERIWLKATELQMGIFPITVLPMLCSFVDSDIHGFNSPDKIRELSEIKSELNGILDLAIEHRMVFMFKTLGIEPNARRSVRHTVAQKLIET